jgi:hypothetical protein
VVAAAAATGASGVSVDAKGNVYIADTSNFRIRKISPSGKITTIAGWAPPTGEKGFAGDGGPAKSARLEQVQDVAVDRKGNIFLADFGNNRVRKISPSGIITTMAGTGQCRPSESGDGGPATSANLCFPVALAVDAKGNVYVAEYGGSGTHRVRKIGPDGTITTIAGTGERGFSGDGGPATSARLNLPGGLAVDARGSVYIMDTWNTRVRKVSPDGTITTIAGNGKPGFSGDGGPATSAQLLGGGYHHGVAVDRQGNVYIADAANYRVRKVTPAGKISTIAGAGLPDRTRPPNFSGDGGPATSARLWGPWGVAVDPRGNVYIADFGGNSATGNSSRIRKVWAR